MVEQRLFQVAIFHHIYNWHEVKAQTSTYRTIYTFG